MFKKLTPLLFLVVLVLGIFLPFVSFAAQTYSACSYGSLDEDGICSASQTVSYEGIVPCGKEVELLDASGMPNDKVVIQCQLCHAFIMVDGIIDYVLIDIIPYITVLMLVIGGIMFYFGGAKPELLSKSKTLFKGVIIGLVLIYGAYLIVGLFLGVLGAADVNPIGDMLDSNNGVFRINCPIKLPKPRP